MRFSSRRILAVAATGLGLAGTAAAVGWAATAAPASPAQTAPAQLPKVDVGVDDYLWQAPTSVPQDEPLVVNVPLGLPELAPVSIVPASNPITKGKYELGRQLYFDPRLSDDNTVSCATCHNPAKGWTDQAPVSAGVRGQTGGRSSPSVINSAYGQTMFWDGRARTLEDQAQGPIANPIEMGDQTHKEIILRLRQIPGYREQFQKVFGTDVTLDGLAKAIATFERVAALSGNSRYDQYVGGLGNEPKLDALTESEKRGMVLFGLTLDQDDPFEPGVVAAKAKCTTCHAGANFTDEKFHNLGVGYDARTGKFADVGRFGPVAVGAKEPAHIGAFKTPTIRDAVNTGPYMHDGSEKTLEAVVEYYDRGGNANPYLDPDMKPLKLTPQEKADLVAFMKALTGEPRPVPLPVLPANADGTRPDPAKALIPPGKKAVALLHPTR